MGRNSTVLSILLLLPWLSSAALSEDKLPAPDPAARQDAVELVREVYAEDYRAAKTADEKLALAELLFKTGMKDDNEPKSRLGLLWEARRLAGEAAGGESSAKELFPVGQWVDVFRMIDVDRHTVVGDWKFSNGVLRVAPAKVARIAVPVAISGGYDVTAVFRIVGADQEVNLMLPVGTTACTFHVNAFGDVGRRTGITHINGISARDNPRSLKGHLLRKGVMYRYDVSVRLSRAGVVDLKAFINGRRVLAWKGRQSALSPDPGWMMPNSRCVGLGAFETAAEFTQVRLRRISGDMKPLDEKHIDSLQFE